MKPIPFDPHKDLAPMVFDPHICQLAQEIKRLGIKWQPHVGCFVWDREDFIRVPSPFPLNIYFILNMNHFLRIFGSVETMKNKLVWLPTWHQCWILLKQMNTDLKIAFERLVAQISPDGYEGIIILYNLVLEKTKEDIHP